MDIKLKIFQDACLIKVIYGPMGASKSISSTRYRFNFSRSHSFIGNKSQNAKNLLPRCTKNGMKSLFFTANYIYIVN